MRTMIDDSSTRGANSDINSCLAETVVLVFVFGTDTSPEVAEWLGIGRSSLGYMSGLLLGFRIALRSGSVWRTLPTGAVNRSIGCAKLNPLRSRFDIRPLSITLRVLLGAHYLQSSFLCNDVLASKRVRVSIRPRVTTLVKPALPHVVRFHTITKLPMMQTCMLSILQKPSSTPKGPSS